MKRYQSWLALSGGLAAVALVVSGCASSGVKSPGGRQAQEFRADERGFVAGTGIESQDLVSVTDRMARSILGVQQIANAKNAPYVVLEPVVNATRFPINKDIFLSRIRAGLNMNAQGKVRFLAREQMKALEREQELKRSGQVTSSTDPNIVEFKGADFFLTGKLEGLTTSTSQGRSDYVLYTFQLIDARTSEITWEASAEIKKQGLEDAAYR